MSRALLLAGALAALALPACGGGGSGAPPAVRLAVTEPQDLATVRDATAVISGTVRPARAVVTVRGRRAQVSGAGAFRATVALAAGVNVVDVIATAGRARPALTAVRVRRIVTVQVPDVTGLSNADARAALRAAGLRPQTDRAGGFFDALLPVAPSVCETEPSAGTEVDPGSTVRLLVAKRC